MARYGIWLFFACTLVSVTPSAHSQDNPDVALLNNQAVELSLKGEYEHAIRIWLGLVKQAGEDHAYRWVFHKNIGRNYQKLSRYPEAWWHLGRCLAPTSQDASLVGEWRREVEEELKKEHVRVRLEVEPLGAAIRLGEGDHSAWYETPLDWWLQPGAHHVLVKAGGGKPQELSFEIVSGMERVALSLPAKEQPADTVVHRPATPIPAPPEDGGPAGVGGGNGQGDPAVPAWKWAVLGSSGALAVGGAVTYHLAASNLSEQQEKHDHWKQETFPPNGEISPGEEETVQSDWDDRFHREVRPYEVTSYVLWGLAGATLLTGAVLLYPDLFPEESTGTSGLAPYLTPGGGGVNAAISF